MNRAFLRTLLHAVLGGFGAGLMMVPSGVPLTVGTVIYPALGSALTSIISLWATAPKIQ